MTSPKVIYTCKFNLALNSPDRFVTYNKVAAENNINAMFNYFANVKKRAINMFDYFEGKINKTEKANLILENGEYATPENIAIRKKQYSKYFEKSNLWLGILSFDNNFVEESIELKELEKLMATKVMPDFLKYCGFKDIDKMSYQLALHTNTKHYHFHFSFIEKEPNYIGAKNRLIYRRYGKISKDEMRYLKTRTLHMISCHKEFTPLVIETNKEIDELKKYFKPTERNFILRNVDDLILEENILTLGKMLDEKRQGKDTRIKFNSIDELEIKKLTKNIKNYLFKDKDSSLYKIENEFKKSLSHINDYFYSLNEDNHIKKKKFKSDYSISKEDYIDNYIYNAIVNHAAYKYSTLKKNKSYLNENDIIQEAILKIYKKNKKQSKYDLLVNYLSNINRNNQFKNRYKIEQSIKNINCEMDEAIAEFSKLFKEDYSGYRKEDSI